MWPEEEFVQFREPLNLARPLQIGRRSGEPQIKTRERHCPCSNDYAYSLSNRLFRAAVSIRVVACRAADPPMGLEPRQ